VGNKYTDNVFPTFGDDLSTGHTAGGPYSSKTVSQTQETIDVLVMSVWIDMGRPVGPYWVLDQDGWFYWAQPLPPGEATGLLLNGVRLENALTDAYYYGVNAVMQAATWNDRDAFSTGLDAVVTGKTNTITVEGKSLLATITGNFAYGLTGTNAADKNTLIRDDAGTLWRVLYVDEDTQRALILRERVISDPNTGNGIAVRLHSAATPTWATSELKNALNGTVATTPLSIISGYFSQLPATLQAQALNTVVQTYQSNNDTTPTASSAGATTPNHLFLLSEYDINERWFNVYAAGAPSGTGRAQEATVPGISFANDIFSTAAKRIAYDDNGNPCNWWVRSCARASGNGLIVPLDGGPYTWGKHTGDSDDYWGDPSVAYTLAPTAIPVTSPNRIAAPMGYPSPLTPTGTVSIPYPGVTLVTAATNIVVATAQPGAAGTATYKGVCVRPAMWIDITR
jgi:hypothetical protein